MQPGCISLLRRAVPVGIRAKDTAIAWLRPQDCAATGALICDHSGIGRHLLLLDEPTLRTGDQSVEMYVHIYRDSMLSVESPFGDYFFETGCSICSGSLIGRARQNYIAPVLRRRISECSSAGWRHKCHPSRFVSRRERITGL